MSSSPNQDSHPSKPRSFFKGVHRRMSSLAKSTGSKLPTSDIHRHHTIFEIITSSSHGSSDTNVPPRKYNERDARLLDMDKLSIPARDRIWFEKVNIEARLRLNGGDFNATQDYDHAVRVVKETHDLWLAEKHHEYAHNIDPLVIIVAALVHSIGNQERVEDAETGVVSLTSGTQMQELHRDNVREFLDKYHCPPAVGGPASHIASFISFVRETNNTENIQLECDDYPALKIVQDADRLDALGAMGVTRAIFSAGLQARGPKGVLGIVKSIDERYAWYPGRMKTASGRKMAEKRWGWIMKYREALLEQADCEDILEAR